jgi:hypothetical protein
MTRKLLGIVTQPPLALECHGRVNEGIATHVEETTHQQSNHIDAGTRQAVSMRWKNPIQRNMYHHEILYARWQR